MRGLIENEARGLPLCIRRDEIFLDLADIFCDLWEFRNIYETETHSYGWERAVALYSAPLLFENCYEWAVLEEAYYDVRYAELLEKLAVCYRAEGRTKLAAFYEEKLQEFS